MKAILIILFLFISHFSISQNEENYLKKITSYDSTAQARIIGFNYNYLFLSKQDIFISGAGQISLSINFAKLFTKKVFIGLYGDIKILSGIKTQNFSNEFVNDFNSSFNSVYSASVDSSNSYLFKESINKNLEHHFSGNNYGNYGVIISPFPLKHGGFTLIWSKGIRQFSFYKDKNDIKDLILKNNYFLELSMKPYLFFKKGKLSQEVPGFKDLYKQITFSLYYEKISLQGATVENLPLNQIVNENFISKYNDQKHFGFKIGLSLY